MFIQPLFEKEQSPHIVRETAEQPSIQKVLAALLGYSIIHALDCIFKIRCMNGSEKDRMIVPNFCISTIFFHILYAL